jgi:hypothetical protein
MAEAINSTTRKRHDIIWEIYKQRLCELGDEAVNVSKNSLYKEVARRTGYSQDRVQQVIYTKLKNGNSR